MIIGDKKKITFIFQTKHHNIPCCLAGNYSVTKDDCYKHVAYLLIGMRKEKERSWFQYGSIGFMGSGEDSRFKYSFVESSLKLLLLAPMICKISVEYRTTSPSCIISPRWICSQLLRIIRSFSIFSSIESLNGLNFV